MKRTVKIFIVIGLIFNIQLSSLNSALAQIGCKMTKKESCKPGKDGEAKITGMTNSMISMCSIEWVGPDGQKLVGINPIGMKAGAWSVTVKATPCNKIIYQDVCIIEKENACKIGAGISVTSHEVPCNVQPSATLTAYPIGGTPPYTYTWKTMTVSGSGTYGVTITDSNGFVGSAKVSVSLKMTKCPEDPNEIDGPIGYGDEHLVSTNEKMRYTILYENSPEFASAPASLVNITYPIPPEQNINSVRLSDFGFGSFVFSVPSNTTAYTQRLDVSDSLGVWVDVTAGIDMANNQVFWNLQSVDPATGFEPASADLGFLLINDSLHHGEGYVSFSIAPKNSVTSGDTVGAEATIIFNENTAIATNVWTNKFDAVAPTSTLHASIEADDTMACNFTFSANDDLSGVDNVELLVSLNGDAYNSIGYFAVTDTAHYALEDGYVYRFISRATDNVGNQEPLKSRPDTIINNNTAPVDILLSNNGFEENAGNGVLIGTLTSIDNDITKPFVYELVTGEGDDDNLSFYIEGNGLYTGSSYACTGNFDYTVRIRTTDITGLSFEKAFELLATQQNFPYVKSSNESICQGSAYVFGNRNLVTAGTYTDSLTTVRGCDSIITVNLAVHPTSQHTETQVACEKQSFSWAEHGLTIDTLEAGHYYYHDTMYTQMGCDSTFTLVLNVNATSTSTDVQTACDIYTWHGGTYTASGEFAYLTTNAAGCDSVVTLNLTVRYSNTGDTTATACDNFSWWNTNYTNSTNNATHVLSNAAGCDSVVTLNLTVNHSSSSNEAITACDSYIWHGTTYNASNNTATFVGTNAVGCDSVVTLNLTVNYSNSSVDVQNVCDSYTWHGNSYTASTSTPTYIEQNAAGCDSVVTLNLTVRYSNTGDTTATACDNFNWWNINYTNSTNEATHVLSNAAGCDSVVTLNLTINNSSSSNEVLTACDSYIWHGTTYNASNNTATFVGTNAVGCDSVVTLNLTVNYSNSGVEVLTACDSYTWHGTNYTASNNTATFVGTNAVGCDSVTTLNLTINYSNSGVDVQDVCDSYTWHGTTYTASTNTPTYVEQNAAGCDSVVTLNLTVRYSTSGDTAAVACDSYTWHDNTYTTSGTYIYQTTNTVGCDSVVTLNLTINHSTMADTAAEACDSYTWHGNTYTASGTYMHQTTNAVGCDSVLTLNLTVNYSNSGIDVQTACDEFVWIDGVTYTVGGDDIATYTTSNAAGCDSVVTLNLTLNHSVTVYDSLSLTSNEIPYDYHGNTVNGAGDFTFDGTTAQGCDSTTLLHVAVTVVGLDVADPLAELKVYPNPTQGSLTIEAEDVLLVEVFDIAGRKVATFEEVNTFDITSLATGTYTLKIQTTRGETVRRIVKK